jgi:dihydrolipoamide dehydrogenase
MNDIVSQRVDLAIIGAGPGGYAAAFTAADAGLSVALVDPESNPGGVCLYRGCIPSKALLSTASLITESRESEIRGLRFTDPEIDLDRLRAWKDGVVAKLTGGLGQLARQRKIQYLRGMAKFTGLRTISIELIDGGERSLVFDQAIIATGGRPASLPNTSFTSRIWDSTEALRLPEIPKTLLVVGGGFIGLELGTVYASLGSKVTVVEMLPDLASGADPELVRVWRQRASRSMEIFTETKVQNIKEESDGVQVTCSGPSGEWERKFDRILVSIGRSPNSENLGFETVKVERDSKGFIRVNERFETSESGILAIGDLIGGPLLAHKAAREGKDVVSVILGKSIETSIVIPSVVYTDPEIAWCGLTLSQATKESRKVSVSRFPWAASGRALTMGRPDGVTMLIADPDTGLLLGAGITGPHAGELIAETALAVNRLTVHEIGSVVHAHPTLSETVMEAADMVFGQALHVYRQKR